MKVVTVECRFAELRNGDQVQKGRGQGTTLKSAASRAIRDVLSTIKRKRVSQCTINMHVDTL